MRIGKRACRARFYLSTDDTIDGLLIGRRRNEYVVAAAEVVTGTDKRVELKGVARIPVSNVRWYTVED